MNQPPNRVKVIFLEALEHKTTADRIAFLSAKCGTDSTLRQRVEDLLNSFEGAGSFLDGHAVASAGDIESLDPLIGKDMQPKMESPSQVIGPYKLMEQIGEGGFGLVFVAEQQEPVRRRVALKLIKPGMDSRDVISRFEAERQALALMDHPNIARVLDAGTTGSGRPYFVMELVRGIPITEYCDQGQLSPQDRLELFVSVCRAIQHAHQKGIIHRDIKPSNVLVTLHDGEPVVKVIDFGVAKALNQRLTERTVYTKFSQMIGTPMYMSPEQAEMSGLDVDTRSDIYSLGVLLYELLTGSTPFDRERLSAAAFDEIRRIIREEEPPKPSTRLSTSGDRLPLLAAQRKTDPGKLSKIIRGELDWIIMKALEKDRNRRYATANGFAADVLRYVSNDTVEACPPTAGYRLRKFARRNKPLLATTALVAAALIVGTVVSAWQAVRAGKAEAKAQVAAAAARDNAVAARGNANRANHEAARALASQKELLDSESELRERVYATDMNLISEAYANGAIDRMNDLLKNHLPRSTADDQRGLEWYHWWQAGHLERGKVRHPLTASFRRLAVSPDGKTIALSGWPQQLFLYDSEKLLLLRAPIRIDGENSRLCFSPDGRFLVVGAEWNSIGARVLDTNSWETIATLPGDFTAIAFAPGESRMAIGIWHESQYCEIQLWREVDATWTYIESWNSSFKPENLSFTPDGKTLVAHVLTDYQGNGQIDIWDVQEGKVIRNLDVEETKTTASIAMSHDYLAIGERDGDIQLWKAESLAGSGEPIPIRTLSVSGPVTSLAFSPDGTRLVAATLDKLVVSDTDPESSDPPLIVHAHSRQVSGVKFGRDSNTVYSAGEDGYLKTWSLSRCQPYDTIHGVDPMSQVGYADDDTLIYHNLEGKIQRRSVQDGKLRTPLDKGTRYHRIALSADGGYLAGLTHSDKLRVWNLASRSKVHEKAGVTDSDCRLVVSRDGRHVAYTTSIRGPEEGTYGDISLMDFENGTPKTDGALLERVRFRAWQAFAPDSKHLVVQRTNANKFSSHLLDIGSDPIEQHYQLGGWGPDTCAAFSPDGSTLAIGSYSYNIRLHHAASGELKYTLRGHTDVPQCLTFMRDGRRLVSAGDDGTVRIWQVGASECQLVSTLRGHAGKIEFVAVSPEGTSVATVGKDETLLVWRTAKQSEIDHNVDRKLERAQDQITMRGQPDKARLELEAAQQIAPDNLQVLSWRAKLHLTAGEWNSAIADFDRALSMVKNNQYFLQSRAKARAQSGQLNGSLDDWTRLVQLTDGGNRDYLYRRAECYVQLGRRSDASADFLRVLQLELGQGGSPETLYRQVASSLMLAQAVVPNGTTWRYSTNRPPGGWEMPSVDDSSWVVGAAPFGSRIASQSKWYKTTEIWLRRTFELDQELASPLMLRVLADDHADVYLNGVFAAHVSGSTQGYKTVDCSQQARLRRGENTLAVHCVDEGGDAAAIDVGLYLRGDPATFAKALTAALEQAREASESQTGLGQKQRRWKRTAETFGRLVAAHVDVRPTDALMHMRAAILRAYTEDLDRFHELSSRSLELFAATGVPDVAERIAKGCLVAPPSEDNLPLAKALADKALSLDPRDAGFIPRAQLTKALCEHRSGNDQAAVEWAEKCMAVSADVPVRKSLCLGVLALAQARLGDRDAALEAESAFTRSLQEHSPLHTGTQPGRMWHNWLVCELFLRELKEQASVQE